MLDVTEVVGVFLADVRLEAHGGRGVAGLGRFDFGDAGHSGERFPDVFSLSKRRYGRQASRMHEERADSLRG